ncbi:Ubiquitin carboxyl-terminal hydrolase 34 [Tritrichomonas musculus]|uniref:Ubiquitin carboxyl-terminal hydrolase 34 n=1 Tax=Tritrichomonas musculus TaxID=1915356 RepID=A0ABR2K1U9_9EUKA
MSSEIQDYYKWTKNFLNSFGYTSQRFLNYYPTFESMIDEYCDNFSLLPPYENKTNDFLYTFVPEIASKIYRLTNLKDDALEFSFNQLLKILYLCVFLSEQCDFKLNKTMKLILDNKQNIYRYNDQLFSMLCELFVSYEYYQRLIARCRDIKPNIKNLSLVFSIRAKIFSAVAIELSEVLSILPDFIIQFKGDSIRTVDSNKLNKIIQKYIVPTFPRRISQGDGSAAIDFSPFFRFCQILILSGNLDKQLLGIKFLNSYLSNTAKDTTSLDSWIKENPESKQLLDFISQTPELHLEFIKLLEPLLLHLSSSHLVQIDYIDQLFQTAKKMGKEESTDLLKLIVKCLNSISNESSTLEWLNLTKKFIFAHKDSPELLTAIILNSSSIENSRDCISYLFKNKALNDIKSIVNSKTRKLILDEIMKIAKNREKIDLEEVKIAADALSFLISSSINYKTDFGDPKLFVHEIISNFSFPDDKSLIYPILVSFYSKSRESLEIEVIPEIFNLQQKTGSDLFWNFLEDIINANKRYSLKRDVCDLLFNTIEQISDNYFPTSTESFIKSFRLLFMIKCANEYIGEFGSSRSLESFRFRKFPQRYFLLLVKLYFSTNEHEVMNSFMLETLTKYSIVPINDIYKALTIYFIPKLIPRANSNVDNAVRYYVIKLIYDVLTTVEKGIYLEDYGNKPKRRHCEIADNSIELTLVMETKDKKSMTVIRKIHSLTSVNCDVFLKRVKNIMGDQNAKAFNTSILLNQPSPLENYSVKKDCNINVIGVYRPLMANILSLSLTENDSILLDPLFNILKSLNANNKENIRLAEITSKLLYFLPSIQNLNIDFDLSKCINYYLFIYCIQILASSSKMNEETINSLVKIFNSRKYKEADLVIIQILIQSFDKEKSPQYLELLIDPLFECINLSQLKEKNQSCDLYNLNNDNNDKFKNLNQILLSISDDDSHSLLFEKALKLLRKLTKYRKEAGLILSKKSNSVVELALNSSKLTSKISIARKIFKIIDQIPNLNEIFPIFVKKIPVQLSDNKFVIKLFSNLWNKMQDSGQITKDPIGKLLLQKCIDCVDFPSIDIFILCKIVRKTVKSLLVLKPNDDKNGLKLDSDILNYAEQFAIKLFDLLFIRDDKNLLTPIFRFIEKFQKYDIKLGANHRLLDITEKCLLNLFSKVGKSNHYNMSATKYPPSDFTGLQNLGSTCFINTIIQPLFYTYQFRFNVLFNKDISEKTENKNLMYDLFTEMLTTQKGYVKMNEFVSQFSTDIETNRQQDCVEYLLILSEKLGKQSYNLFKGVLVDHLTSSISSSNLIENDSRDEDFIHLSVNVQKFKNLEDSLKSLFGNSVLVSPSESSVSNSETNLSVLSGAESNLQKYSRIKVAPQFLIICLNRFEYNLKTFQKIKINSKFSFPFILDVSEYVESNDKGSANDDIFADCNGIYKYELYAVSIHNGNADSGHYTALVKINGDWIDFNDRSAKKITKEEVMALSFGTDNQREANRERNAYVLYYRRLLQINNPNNNNNENENVSAGNEKVIDLYNEKIIDQVFMRFSEKIEKKLHLSMYYDESALRHQKDRFRDYSISDLNSNLQVLISYFFNVYCHSSSKDCKDYVEKFIKKLNDLEKVEDISKSGDSLFNFLLNQTDGSNFNNTYCPKLIETFLKCKIEQIMLSIRNLILNYSDNIKCKDVLTLLISNLSLFKDKPEKLESITPLFLGYVTKDQTQKTEVKPSRIQIARDMNWGKKILEFIDFCSQKLSESYQRKVRLSDLLVLLKDLLLVDTEMLEEKASSYSKTLSKSIIDSIKKNIKFLLMNSFNSLPLLELFNVAVSFSSTSSSNLAPSAQFIKAIEDSSRSDTRNKLIMNFIIGLIECDADSEMVCDCLFYEMSKTELSSFFKDYLRNPNNENCYLKQFLADNYFNFVLPELISAKKDTRLKAEHLTYDMFVEVKPPTKSPQYTYSRSTNNRSPTESLIRFSKDLNHFFDKVFEIIDEMTSKEKSVKKSGSIKISTSSCPRDYDLYIFENFLRVVKWTIKRVKNCSNEKLEKSIISDENHYLNLFNQIYNAYLFINSKNSRSSRYNPDANYRAIVDIFKALPYEKILLSTRKEGDSKITLDENEVVEKIENVITNSLDFVPLSITLSDEISKILLIISTVNTGNKNVKQTSSNNLLLRIYENERFVNFFKSQKKFRQDETRFEKFYSSTISTVFLNSELYRKESLIILDNPLNFSLEYALLTAMLETVYHLLPGNFIIKLMKWIIKNVNMRAEPADFMETVFSINSSVKKGLLPSNTRIPVEELFEKNTTPLKSYSSQPVSAIKTDGNRTIDKNCDLIKSFDCIGYKGKMRYDDSIHYFTFVKYICSICQSEAASNNSLSFLKFVPDEILMKLLGKMNLIDGSNVSYFAFEVSTFFDLLTDFKRFELVSQFVNGIFPLSSIGYWSSNTKILQIFLKLFESTVDVVNTGNDEIDLMFDSLFLVTKNMLTEIILSGSSSKIVDYSLAFLKNLKPEMMKRMINELVNEFNLENNVNKKKIITENLRKIIRWFPVYTEYTKNMIEL